MSPTIKVSTIFIEFTSTISYNKIMNKSKTCCELERKTSKKIALLIILQY